MVNRFCSKLQRIIISADLNRNQFSRIWSCSVHSNQTCHVLNFWRNIWGGERLWCAAVPWWSSEDFPESVIVPFWITGIELWSPGLAASSFAWWACLPFSQLLTGCCLSFCCCLKTLGLYCRDGSAVKGWTHNLVTPPSWVECPLQEVSLKSGTFSKHYFLPGVVVFSFNPSTRKMNKNYFLYLII